MTYVKWDPFRDFVSLDRGLNAVLNAATRGERKSPTFPITPCIPMALPLLLSIRRAMSDKPAG